MLAITTLTYNRLELTQRTLEAFYQRYDLEERPYHVFVDNGSRDGTVEWLRASGTAAEIIALPRNLGCGWGTSLAMRAAALAPARPKYVLHLENDWLCLGPCVSWALEVLERNPEAERLAFHLKPERAAALRSSGAPPVAVSLRSHYPPRPGRVTFLPSVLRMSLVERWFPVRTERESILRGPVPSIFPVEADLFQHIGGDPLPSPLEGARWKRRGSYGAHWEQGWLP
jgi:hypothetical protein